MHNLIFFAVNCSILITRLFEQNETEVVLNFTSNSNTTRNESYSLIVKQRRERKISILERTEGKLIQARAAIREAKNVNQTYDLDYVPVGPMYWNAKAFHR